MRNFISLMLLFALAYQANAFLFAERLYGFSAEECTLPPAEDMSKALPYIRIYSKKFFGFYPSRAEKAAERVKLALRRNTQGIHNITMFMDEYTQRSYVRSRQWERAAKDKIRNKYGDHHMVFWFLWGPNFPADDERKEYPQQVANTPVAAEYIGTIAKSLKEDPRFRHINIHGVGASVGAHVMGQAARFSGGALSRITALDPATHCFDVHNEDLRLRNTDAPFVDVIHTDGNPDPLTLTVTRHEGTLAPLGDIDFYPNWGQRNQPGCNLVGERDDFCSRYKAIEYYLWSIDNPGKFVTSQVITGDITYNSIGKTTTCGATAEMGHHADAPGNARSGHFYLATNSEEPYEE